MLCNTSLFYVLFKNLFLYNYGTIQQINSHRDNKSEKVMCKKKKYMIYLIL